MKVIQKIGILCVLFLVVSCSTRKDTTINRNYHALTTKFNVLYNGNVAFAQGIKDINTKYEDDFFEVLPIEPIRFKGNVIDVPKFQNGFGGPGAPNQNNNQQEALSPFEKAEEKAVKAIQKHSMNIYGKERNKQIDDAYLLLGKSRYYTERFVPAIDAFNYIIANYPKANLIHETRIWRAKANIRIENPELAIETLNILLRQLEITDNIREEAHTALAMAYRKMDSTHRVKQHLWLATITTENINQAARNLFILGQIYAKENKKDSASLVFNKLINLKRAPYKYKIRANIELANNATSDSTTNALLLRFEKLIKNRDNRPYLDALYYEVGVLEQGRDSLGNAIINYKKSLQAKNGSPKQKTYTYEKLANIYFEGLNYVKAGAYYDSILMVAQDKETLRMKKIERKAKNLKSLTKYEKVLATNDSILTLASKTEEEKTQYFQEYIDKLKKEDEKKAQQRLNAISFGNSFGGGVQKTDRKGKWYFYNQQSIGFGKSEFERVWGNRPLEDDWRWSDKTAINKTQEDKVTINQKLARYDVATYLKGIPSTKEAIDSLTFDRNQALFELGLIYKEQFKNIPKAIRNLERLLDSEPDKELILPANYHLYQIYSEEESEKAKGYKNVILTEYAETPFAKIILNPDTQLLQDKEADEVSELYSIAYRLYKDESFGEAICFIDLSLPTIDGSILIPKFELLKAYAIGKYQSKQNYIQALEQVTVNYPTTEEGKRALEVLKALQNSPPNEKK